MTGLRIGSLFSGYGGLDLGVMAALGGSVAWHSEVDKGACKILAHRWPDVPNLGDITKVDWSAVDPVDVLTGGFPCQDLSHAGRRAGLGPSTRSGLWSRMADAIEQLRPALVAVENVRGLLSAAADSDVEPCPWCMGGAADGEPALRALGYLLGDLAELGYDARWLGLRAADVGAPHGRFRVFVVAWPAANADRVGHERAGQAWRRGSGSAHHGGDAPDADGSGREGAQPAPGRHLPDGRATAHPAGDRRDEGRPEPTRLVRRPHAALGCDAAPDADSGRREGVGRLEPVERDIDGRHGSHIAWGDYEPAIRRWERALGRPAPAPTEPGKAGNPRLSPSFVEWIMGLPLGHVTDVPGLSRNEQLKALGNGVVPQQAARALEILLSPGVAS